VHIPVPSGNPVAKTCPLEYLMLAHAKVASTLVNPVPHTDPHCPSMNTSSLPWLGLAPPVTCTGMIWDPACDRYIQLLRGVKEEREGGGGEGGEGGGRRGGRALTAINS
jgi:hypothetical protein